MDISKTSMYCVPEMIIEVSTLTSKFQPILSLNTTLYRKREQSDPL